MRYAILVMMLAGLTACQTKPPGVPVDPESPQVARVMAALSRWPQVPKGSPGIDRAFFVTLHAAGRRVTASGNFRYYGPRDFRITAATEMGVILFDGRVNWAGATVFRQMPGLDKKVVEMILNDLSLAMDVPETPEGMRVVKQNVILQKTLGDKREYTWTFDAGTGELQRTQIHMGLLDTLEANYVAYNAQGRPREITISRPARLYDMHLTFTDAAATEPSGGAGS